MGPETPQLLETSDSDRERILDKIKRFFQIRLDELESSEKWDDEEAAEIKRVGDILSDMEDENFESASQYLSSEIDELQDMLKKEISEEYRARLEVWRAEAQGLLESLNLSEK
jgi:hypothetical protein